MRASLTSLLVAMFGLLGGCGPKPIPQDKAAFVGEWKTPSGFTLRINPDGRAQMYQPADRWTRREFDVAGIKVAPSTTAVMFAELKPQQLIVKKEFLYGKRYRIDEPPHSDGDTTRMVLNGVTFTKR